MAFFWGTSRPSRYTFSDSSDTVITLNNPNAPFAVWDEPDDFTKTHNLANDSSNAPITYHVFSGSLTQASPVFKAALTGGWEEGSETKDGGYNISTDSWDSEAMRIVLSAIHNRTRDIPRRVSLELLCKIAVLVDYYELHSALHFFACLWIDLLRLSLPTVYDRNLILWILASSTFGSDLHKALTHVAIEHSTGKIRTLGLPIRGRLVDDINTRRELALRRLSASLNSIKSDLLDGTAGCCFECRSIHLGALIKHMHDEGILGDAFTPPFQDRSVTATVKKLREMQFPATNWHRQDNIHFSCRFSLSSLTEAAAEETTMAIRGLELEEEVLGTSSKKSKKKKGKSARMMKAEELSPAAEPAAVNISIDTDQRVDNPPSDS